MLPPSSSYYKVILARGDPTVLPSSSISNQLLPPRLGGNYFDYFVESTSGASGVLLHIYAYEMILTRGDPTKLPPSSSYYEVTLH